MSTLTLNFPAGQDPRILAAFGRYMGNARDATPTELKQAFMDFAVSVVKNYELDVAKTAANASITPVTPS